MNVYNNLGRNFYLNKIQSEITELENEFLQNTEELDNVHYKILDIPYGTRTKNNPVWHELHRRRIRLSQRNIIIQRHLKNLHAEYMKYETMQI